MASTCEVHVDTANRADAARVLASVAAEAGRIEKKFSRYRTDNIVHAINTAAGRPLTVDEETARLIDYAARLFELSNGKFDITSGVLRRIWRFDGSDRIPSTEQIDNVRELVGWRRVRWQPPVIELEAGMEIDFGGIGKEYAVDRAGAIAAALTDKCLLNFGGDLRVLGPHANGRPWQVGIEAVDRLSTATHVVEVYRGGVATSGDSRRYLLKDGRRYGHILDPTIGRPVAGAPRSVTVIADTCTQAGTLSTLAMLQGKAAESFLDAQGVRYWCYR
jgi:FAD:protein FMN transferase